MFNLRLKSSTNHFQQITPIAQWNYQKLRQVRKHHCVAGDLGSERDVFQYLSHHTDAVISGCVQDVQRGLSIDEERGRRAVDAGNGGCIFAWDCSDQVKGLIRFTGRQT